MTTKEHYLAPVMEIVETSCEAALLLDASPYIESGQDNDWGNY
jgi:hypothetical protein